MKKYMDIKFGETVAQKGIFAKDSGGGDFETPEAGSYIARCYRLIDVGTQPVTFQGKPSEPKRQVLVYFELLEDEEGKEYRMSDGRPFSVMQRYTLSTNSKATLRKHIDAWRGKALTPEEAANFNVVVLLGKTCRVQITLDEKGDRTWVNIANVGFTKKTPDGVNDEFWWTISDPDLDAFEKFSEWLQTKIQGAEEWPQAVKAAAAKPKEEGVDGEITDQGELKTHTAKNGDVVIDDMPDDPLSLEDIKF